VFTEALQLWRGRPFAEFADEPWATPEVRRLEGARASCRVGLVDALVADDRAPDAISIIRVLVAADPFDEAHRLRQARTLYRAGRAKDALDALRGFRDELADELGLDPSPDLAALEQAILGTTPASTARGACMAT
jgi:DNA-binding SARP family transcriptional activator